MLWSGESSASIRERFAAVEDPKEQARRIAEWSKYFLGDPNNPAHYWIQTEIPKIHLKIYEALANEYRYFYITAPRGFGKSTIAALVYPLYRIYYRLDPYIVIIGKIDKAGIATLRNIKREIATNEKLIAVYGQLKPHRSEGLLWSRHEIQTRNGVFLRSIGMMGDIRGSLEAMYRPTLIIIEDPQTIKTLKEPSTLEAHIDFLERDVMNAIDSRYGKVRLIGNLIGQGCLLLEVQKDSRWVGINFSALDENEKSVWEEWFPTKVLLNERETYRRNGKLDIFMYERMNIPVDAFTHSLKGYKYHRCSLVRQNDQNLLISDEFVDPIPVYTYMAVDPAFSKARSADPRALVTFAKGQFPVRDYAGNIRFVNGLWVLEYDYNQMDPDLIIDRVLELHRKYYYRAVIIETVGGQLIYKSLMDKALQSDEFWFKNPFIFTPVSYQEASKEDRIWTRFQPKCRLGQFFIRPEHGELQDELDLFLQNKRGIHILDALEMGDRYSDVCIESIQHFGDSYDRYRRKKESEGDWSLQDPLSVFRKLGL